MPVWTHDALERVLIRTEEQVSEFMRPLGTIKDLPTKAHDRKKLGEVIAEMTATGTG
jgi:hypothetical protein